ncbi:E3 ubiquitin/ISG15 ligase TRIM25 [Cyrtonyx montezumae]|uniref:E3 ubiquitin/ISG15 ligase TRIM25 n=1 Tax=Cyrtonyx montezumae TaxID=9017 RepID=UPI0032DA683E
MAALSRAPSEPNLTALEEELTCSICLCLFSVPVTVPCGHNFCASCLELTWADQVRDFSCPQCRTAFPERPQLRKNTVLCRVVEQLHGSGAGDGREDDEREEEEQEAAAPIYCDSCLQAAATRTCLTCMASFCAEHLRPHHDSPAFRDHQLCPPVRDLQQRKCPQHNKLFEFFCSQHNCCICSLCLLSHKLCYTSPLQQAKAKAESALKKRLAELHSQSERSVQAMSSVKSFQSQAAEAATRKRDLLRAEFSEIKALIEEKENQTLKVIMEEEKRVCNKFDYIYKVLGNKKNEIQSLRDQIEMALTEGDDVLFLKRAAALQRTPIKEAFVPAIEMDQNMIHAAYQSAINLKDVVKLTVNVSMEKKADAKPTPGKMKSPSVPFPNKPAVKKKATAEQRIPKEKVPPATKTTFLEETDPQDKKSPVKLVPTVGALSTGAPNAATVAKTKELINSFVKKTRMELLQYAANITLDFNTAHIKVALSDRYTKMSVSDTPLNYNHHPQRFTDCPQVMGFQCFKRGVHYWEVEMQKNNFCGIGICYGTVDRHGLDSRLGRNSSSWCIEWFNSKISAWHNDVEKCLPSTKATKIGVLLHCDGGFVLFLTVEEKPSLIYKFKAQFTEAVYPAFWLFSSGTVLSLCQMKP